MSILDEALQDYINKKAREKTKYDMEVYIKLLEDIAYERLHPVKERILELTATLRNIYEIH